MQPAASPANTSCCSPCPLNNYKHPPGNNFTTGHLYVHRTAKGVQQTGYRGKIMNIMTKYLTKYPFQQNIEGEAHRDRKGERDQN